MATIHISRDEAAADFDRWIDRASNGDEIAIEESSKKLAVLHLPEKQHVRLLSESLQRARDRGSKATLDGGFEKNLMDFINSHREPLRNLWD